MSDEIFAPRIDFRDRRLLDPQGVIDDLLKYITAQAKDIHEKNVKLGLRPHDGLTEAGTLAVEGRQLKRRKKKDKGPTLPLGEPSP